MNTYHVFYKGNKVEIKAETSFKAQEAGAKLLKAKKSYQVATVLVAVGDKEIIHSTAEID